MTRHFVHAVRLDRAPRWVANVLDSRWFWHLIAYTGIAVLSVMLWQNSNTVARTQAKQASEDAAKAALVAAAHSKTRADATAAFSRCTQARPLLIRLNRFIAGEKEASATLVVNSQALLDVTPESDPDHATRKANLDRFAKANRKVQAAPKLKVPTVKQCDKARDKVLVDGGLKPKGRP